MTIFSFFSSVCLFVCFLSLRFYPYFLLYLSKKPTIIINYSPLFFPEKSQRRRRSIKLLLSPMRSLLEYHVRSSMEERRKSPASEREREEKTKQSNKKKEKEPRRTGRLLFHHQCQLSPSSYKHTHLALVSLNLSSFMFSP